MLYLRIKTVKPNRMKTMFKCLLAMLMMLAPIMVQAREDKLTALLEECLERERLSPDSIEYNLQLLERERLGGRACAVPYMILSWPRSMPTVPTPMSPASGASAA